MESRSGSYALILRCRSNATTAVGRLGRLDLESGYYIYVGSAFGPGGVRARVSRHLRTEKRKHWHIDYLRALMSPVGVWFCHDRRRLEHEWARLLANLDGFSAIEKFGCSDCSCQSHLFFTASKPALAAISRVDGCDMKWLSPRDVSRPKVGPPAPRRASRNRAAGR